MDYENDLELCEYNPISIQYENELKALAKIVELPAMSFFQKLMKKIVVANTFWNKQTKGGINFRLCCI